MAISDPSVNGWPAIYNFGLRSGCRFGCGAKLELGLCMKLITLCCWLMGARASSLDGAYESTFYSTARPVTTTEIVYQRFAIEPQDQTAVIGSRVTLPCRVLDQKGPVQWTKDDFGLGALRNLTGFERYSMIGSDEEGNFHSSFYHRIPTTKIPVMALQ